VAAGLFIGPNTGLVVVITGEVGLFMGFCITGEVGLFMGFCITGEVGLFMGF